MVHLNRECEKIFVIDANRVWFFFFFFSLHFFSSCYRTYPSNEHTRHVRSDIYYMYIVHTRRISNWHFVHWNFRNLEIVSFFFFHFPFFQYWKCRWATTTLIRFNQMSVRLTWCLRMLMMHPASNTCSKRSIGISFANLPKSSRLWSSRKLIIYFYLFRGTMRIRGQRHRN